MITDFTNELWKMVVNYSSSFNHVETKRIILDRGYSFNFYLSDGDYNTLRYSVIEHDHPLTIKAFEFIELLKECNKIVNDKLQNIQARKMGEVFN